jgi:DNA-binding PadR family transcriptional regulator
MRMRRGRRHRLGYGELRVSRHHMHEGRRRRRVFAHGDLRFLILQLIAEGPKHGYELIKAIEEKLGGSYSPSPGVIYPTLTLLEDLRYVTVSTRDGSRKCYAITRNGVAHLDANKASVKAIFKRIVAARATTTAEPPPQAVRAMENLRVALSLRLARGPLNEQQIRAVAAVIDAAAVAVERS